MLKSIKRWLEAYEDWAEPRWSDTEQMVLSGADQYLFYLYLETDGRITSIQTLSTNTDLHFRRSWKAPWLRYPYFKIALPKSNRTISYFIPQMTVTDPLGHDGPRLATTDEMQSLIINNLKMIDVGSYWPKDISL